jgi:DNA invertase Pin-like site-specific DNA recombinase
MKALIVSRVSTEEQKDAGNSLPAQTERLKSYCSRKSLEIDKEFSFDESAYKNKRDTFDEVVRYIQESKIKLAVCFDKVDRLSRNVFDKRVSLLYEMAVNDQIELHFASEGQIIGPSMSAVEKFQFGMSLGLAKYYSDAISDNVKRAFEQKRRNGDWNGKPRIGYINSLDVNGKKDIVLDPERAHLVERLFILYASGNYSLTTLHTEITKLGLRSVDGNVLSRSNIDLILKDPFYYGTARSKKYGTYPHHYPRIITLELYERCQAVSRKRSNATWKPLSEDFIFKGLLHCKNCGCVMTPEKKKGKFIYYSCTNAKRICKRVYVPEKDLLKPLMDVFEAFAAIPEDVEVRLTDELRANNESEVVYHKKELARIRAEYDRVQNRVDGLMDLLLDKSITKDEYDKKLQQLKDQQYRLDLEAEEHTKADHDYKLTVSRVFSISRRVGSIFERSEPYEKRMLLNYLLQNPTVDGKTLGFTLRSPFNTVLELANCPSGLRG